MDVTLASGRVVPVSTAQLAIFRARLSEAPNGCLEWVDRRNSDGYGLLRVRWQGHEASLAVHRLAWILEYGPIPDGMTVDHRCFNTLCCNTSHLQLLPNRQNASNQRTRGQRLRSQCPAGHPLNDATTYESRRADGRTYRRCKACKADNQRRRDQRRRLTSTG